MDEIPDRPAPHRPPRLAVVLGAKVGSGGEGSPALKRRARHAAALYRGGLVDGLILSGGGTPRTEAEVMAELCLRDGVPEQAIRIEDKALTTADNLRLSARIARGMGAERLLVVTDRWHLPRALLAARRLGIAAEGAAPDGPVPRGSRLWRERLARAKYWLTLWR